MSLQSSPYEVLGLRPGADREAIERAYRRLIKQHHPDLGGGDGGAARAIIAAYRDLKRADRQLPVVIEPPPASRRKRRSWVVMAAVAAAAAALWWTPWPRLDLGEAGATPAILRARPGTVPASPGLLPQVDPDRASVEAGVLEAERLGSQSPERLLSYSRACAADLQRLPGDAMLDHCLGFDMAAAYQMRLSGSEPEKAFGAGHLEAASVVLQDPVLAEARVGKIRRLVEQRMLENRPELIR
jgi:hypothetical protein